MLKIKKNSLIKSLRRSYVKPLSLLVVCWIVILLSPKQVREDFKNESLFALVGSIHFYKRVISPSGAPDCAFYPSCSQYAKCCFEEHGWVKGSLLTLDRLTRCNREPWIYPIIYKNQEAKKFDPVTNSTEILKM